MPSTVIQHFGYDPTTRDLRVTFMSGRTYVYLGVPPAVVADFNAAGSKGQFFNLAIRDHYRFRELPRPPQRKRRRETSPSG